MALPTASDLKRFLASSYGIFFIITWALYLAVDYIGEFRGLAANNTCIAFFGCTNGFFGFDAFEHFLSGFAFAITIALIFRYFPKISLFSSELPKWKQAVILVTMVATIAVLWELGESIHDVFRLAVLHEPLYSVKFHIDLLDQPSNLDTVGDMTFNILGSIAAVLFARFSIQKPGPKA